jgi:hypothetical protein
VRTTFGAVLFIAWGIATVVWVYTAVLALVDGEAGPAIRAVCALLLMILLAGMEGLEVAVIDRWRELYPERSTSDLAGWLAARQLFVALICTTATLLAEPELIAVPFSSMEITGGFALKAHHHLDGVDPAVVHADLPQAHGRDEPGPLPQVHARDVVPDRRGRTQDRNCAAG